MALYAIEIAPQIIPNPLSLQVFFSPELATLEAQALDHQVWTSWKGEDLPLGLPGHDLNTEPHQLWLWAVQRDSQLWEKLKVTTYDLWHQEDKAKIVHEFLTPVLLDHTTRPLVRRASFWTVNINCVYGSNTRGKFQWMEGGGWLPPPVTDLWLFSQATPGVFLWFFSKDTPGTAWKEEFWTVEEREVRRLPSVGNMRGYRAPSILSDFPLCGTQVIWSGGGEMISLTWQFQNWGLGGEIYQIITPNILLSFSLFLFLSNPTELRNCSCNNTGCNNKDPSSPLFQVGDHLGQSIES